MQVTTTDRVPPGGHRLLREAVGRRWWVRPVSWLRATHAMWLLDALPAEQTRVVAAHDGDRLVGIVVALRFDAHLRPRHLLAVTAVAVSIGLVLGAVVSGTALHPDMAVTSIVATSLLLALGAALRDGKAGWCGARAARRRAAVLAQGHAWGRGLVAVVDEARRTGVGRALTEELLASLPLHDRWLPVAMTPAAAGFYERLGGTHVDGAAFEFTGRPALTTAA